MTDDGDFHTLLGAQLLLWQEGHARLCLDVERKHLNHAGILHGGVLLTLLDEVGAMCGLWCSVAGNRRTSVTVDLDCRFVGQSSSGRIVASGNLVSHGKSLYFTRTQVAAADGRILAYGASSHKWRRGSEAPEGSPHR